MWIPLNEDSASEKTTTKNFRKVFAHNHGDPYTIRQPVRSRVPSRRGIPQCGILVLCFVAGYGEVSRQQVLLDLGMDLYDGAAVTDIV